MCSHHAHTAAQQRRKRSTPMAWAPLDALLRARQQQQPPLSSAASPATPAAAAGCWLLLHNGCTKRASSCAPAAECTKRARTAPAAAILLTQPLYERGSTNRQRPGDNVPAVCDECVTSLTDPEVNTQHFLHLCARSGRWRCGHTRNNECEQRRRGEPKQANASKLSAHTRSPDAFRP